MSHSCESESGVFYFPFQYLRDLRSKINILWYGGRDTSNKQPQRARVRMEFPCKYLVACARCDIGGEHRDRRLTHLSLREREWEWSFLANIWLHVPGAVQMIAGSSETIINYFCQAVPFSKIRIQLFWKTVNVCELHKCIEEYLFSFSKTIPKLDLYFLEVSNIRDLHHSDVATLHRVELVWLPGGSCWQRINNQLRGHTYYPPNTSTPTHLFT